MVTATNRFEPRRSDSSSATMITIASTHPSRRRWDEFDDERLAQSLGQLLRKQT